MNGRPASRRRLLQAAAFALLPAPGLGQEAGAAPAPASAALPSIPALDQFLAGRAPRLGRLRIEMPQLAEDSGSVPVRIEVPGPLAPDDSVRSIRIFSEKNPVPVIASFRFQPGLPRVELEARVRLADTQTVVAVAELDGGDVLAASANVAVTLSACLDPG